MLLVSNLAALFIFDLHIVSSFLLTSTSQTGFVVADLPSERGKDTETHYLRYTDDPILTDTKRKQSMKVASRIGRIKSWKPPKSFLPVAGSISFSKMKRRRGTSGGKSKFTPVNVIGSAKEDLDIEKNECKIEYELESKQHASPRDCSKQKPWKHFLKVGMSALKLEIDEHQGAGRHSPTESDSGRDEYQSAKLQDPVQSRRFSCNSAGSEVVW